MKNRISFTPGNITVHMVGIGGISMSGLAEILMHKGIKITGSDIRESDITEMLRNMGAVVFPSHDASNITNQDLVVYSAAIPQDNPELAEARNRGIPVMERAELLGVIMDHFQHCIAVSGTHGKTTTTSMISQVMLEGGLDPTVHVGGMLDAIGGNTRIGSSSWFIAEACEYKDSFLKIRPTLAVVLNIEADHLDYFRDIDHIRSSFQSFLSNVREPGIIVLNYDDPQTRLLSKSLTRPFVSYGLNSPDADWTCEDISFEDGCAGFTVFHKKSSWGRVKLQVPGLHNVSNSLACIAACHALGVARTSIIKGLEGYRGTHRRLEDKGMKNGIRVMDDYAHHPTEIQATLRAARALAAGHLICIFQPHTYTRSYELLDDFSRAFALADTVVVTDIYAAREKDNGLINSRTITEGINRNTGNAVYISDFGDIVRFIEENAQTGDLVITMGAGDIHMVGEMYLSRTGSP
ncbi:MAG TPA: UDP-N-acetylmuramate--L-alanine ligase [Thermoclostridium sp.]|nr:UDP-N-acetylmuramate--L-alanine ligase [Clostridiaceae bacterium]HOQ75176.1 UDP-N-acetylmuramate--L-alanine ligase [Thermoclostridium sp.]HPU44695.1 UDP-N-acetylmuramate--L-alanine ligase [Thermoclostridium sp.]